MWLAKFGSFAVPALHSFVVSCYWCYFVFWFLAATFAKQETTAQPPIFCFSFILDDGCQMVGEYFADSFSRCHFYQCAPAGPNSLKATQHRCPKSTVTRETFLTSRNEIYFTQPCSEFGEECMRPFPLFAPWHQDRTGEPAPVRQNITDSNLDINGTETTTNHL